jgi:hypothetical protein
MRNPASTCQTLLAETSVVPLSKLSLPASQSTE